MRRFWIAALAFSMGWQATPAPACQWDTYITEQAEQYGVPWRVAIAICHAESSGNPDCIGKDGEVGLFQFTKKRWIDAGGQESYSQIIERTPTSTGYTIVSFPEIAKNPHQNICLAIRELSKCGKNRDPRVYAAWWNAGRMDYWSLSKKWSVNHPNKIYRAIYRGEIGR